MVLTCTCNGAQPDDSTVSASSAYDGNSSVVAPSASSAACPGGCSQNPSPTSMVPASNARACNARNVGCNPPSACVEPMHIKASYCSSPISAASWQRISTRSLTPRASACASAAAVASADRSTPTPVADGTSSSNRTSHCADPQPTSRMRRGSRAATRRSSDSTVGSDSGAATRWLRWAIADSRSRFTSTDRDAWCGDIHGKVVRHAFHPAEHERLLSSGVDAVGVESGERGLGDERLAGSCLLHQPRRDIDVDTEIVAADDLRLSGVDAGADERPESGHLHLLEPLARVGHGVERQLRGGEDRHESVTETLHDPA